MKCLTCNLELKPQTSVPRIPDSDYRRQQEAQRAQEIAKGKLGYLGEAEFCNKDCAAFFGRASVHFMRHITIMPDAYEHRVAGIGRLAQRIYQWVEDRMEK